MKDLSIVIAGGSGFMGSAMTARWAAQNRITILGRKGRAVPGDMRVTYLTWDGKTPGSWQKALEGADLLINLAGKSVNCRYTEEHKKEIMQSRVAATEVLGRAVSACMHPPRLWINAASATIYRHATDRPQDEFNGEMADDFSVQVCKAWEKAFDEAEVPGTRKAALRTAIVLGKGGALQPYVRLARLGLGGRQGSGKQMFSWIHIDDIGRIVEWLWEHGEAQGVFNASAPGPVANEAFMRILRKVLGVPFGLPAPEWMLRAGAAVIGTETELLLKSRWVLPSRLLAAGFTFQYPDLEPAIRDLAG